MKLVLMLDGVEHSYRTGNRFPALIFKRALKVADKLEKDFTVEALEEAVEFIAKELFHDQFTADDFWEGVDSADLMNVIRDCLMTPAKAIQSKMEEMPKN